MNNVKKLLKYLFPQIFCNHDFKLVQKTIYTFENLYAGKRLTFIYNKCGKKKIIKYE
jgi:hypothetical protein